MKQRRNTRQRDLILEAVRTRRDHPSADQVYLSVREKAPNISRGTVYRNLHLLVGSGKIRRVQISGVEHFDWRAEPHSHLLCTVCGKVCDSPVPYHAELDRKAEEESGFEMIQHCTVFEGICPDCRQNRKQAGFPPILSPNLHGDGKDHQKE